MKHLKFILLIALPFFLITSCKKSSDDKSGNIPSKPLPAKIIDTDAFIHSISFNAPTQNVTTRVTGNQLNMVYNEDVTLFLPKEGYELSWAVHLTESFTNSILPTFTFTTVDEVGDITTDWVDDNLNNITAKTVSDTTIAGVAMVKVNVKRPFTFTNTYDDNDSAVNAQNAILMLNTDKINFSSYVFFTKTYPTTSTSVKISYVKAD